MRMVVTAGGGLYPLAAPPVGHSHLPLAAPVGLSHLPLAAPVGLNHLPLAARGQLHAVKDLPLPGTGLLAAPALHLVREARQLATGVPHLMSEMLAGPKPATDVMMIRETTGVTAEV